MTSPSRLLRGGAAASPARRLLRGEVVVTAGVAAMNIGNYAFTILAARMLGPRAYGGFAAAVGLLLVLGVLQLGLQATGARRLAADPAHADVVRRDLRTLGRRTAAGVGVALLVLAPVTRPTLHLANLLSAVLLAGCAVPLTLMGAQAGLLQGARRWRPLAAVYAVAGIARVVVGAGLLAWRPDETAALAGVFAGLCVPVLIGWLALRETPVRTVPRGGRLGGVVRETAHNSHALLAFLALSNADVILARAVLDPHASGLYGGGLILTKAVLFLPQFVVVVAFPDLAVPRQRRRMLLGSLAVVVVLGAVAAIGAAVFGNLALAFVGGHDYAAVRASLWRFALLGGVLSLVQLLVYGAVARQSRIAVYAVWAGVAAIAAGAWFQSAVGSMLTLVTAADVGVLLGLVALTLRPGPAGRWASLHQDG